MVDNAYILDNGAYSIKVEHSKAKEPKIIPNCIMKAKSERRRLFIGDQVEECRDASGLFYLLPFQKGLIMNWDYQKTVWDYVFGKDCCPSNFSETPVIITEPYFNFASIQEAVAEIFFEEYECQSFLRINGNICLKSISCFVICIHNKTLGYLSTTFIYNAFLRMGVGLLLGT